MKPVTIDFETKGIDPRPYYPPAPVGVAIKYPNKPGKYYSWGHTAGKNNSTHQKACEALRKAWNWKHGILFQNGKFDIEVAEKHMGMERKPWQHYHDTMFLLFLDDPHQNTFSLKPAAERLLGLPPEEQDDVKEWLIANQPVEGVRISASQKSEHFFGRYISEAPAELVGKYAVGDVERTEQLFKLLYPSIVDRGMLPAYDRERELVFVLLENEQHGIPIDLLKMEQDIRMYQGFMGKIDAWIEKRLGVKGLNLNSGAQVMKAIIDAGLGDEDKLQYTDKGNVKSDKAAVAECSTDKQLVGLLKYRSQLNTCINTFMVPWMATAETTGGLIHTRWNQIKASERGDNEGAKTGRLSSSPNFQNIPNEFQPIFHHEDVSAGLPRCPIKGLPPLPKVRGYVRPFKGHVICDRDYSQQELRILGHYEEGELKAAYEENLWMDVHAFAQELINKKTGKNFGRKPIKNTSFGLLYGMGIGKLAAKSDITVDMAKEVKAAYLAIFPGLKAMYADMKIRAAANRPLRTWGGREYYCEPPAVIKGILRTFDYRMVNKLIQGSAADCTKEALIRYARVKPASHKILMTVHDEIVVSVPKREVKKGMELLRAAMESIEFDIPILSEGKIGESLSTLQPFDKKGVICQ